jgi:DNA-binding LytR/AlgR family response regulator
VSKAVSLVRNSTATEADIYEQILLPGSFFIRIDSQFVRLNYHEVVYVEALKDFTKIYTTDGRTHLTLVNLKNLEEQLPTGMFVRTHRSYLVNTMHIESVSSQEVRVGGQSLPLGQTYRERLTEGVVNRSLIRRQH